MFAEAVETVSFHSAGVEYLTNVSRPSFIYDRETKCWLKYGEHADIDKIYNEWRDVFIAAGFPQMADDLAVLELPPHQPLIDQLFQCSGMFERYLVEQQLN